MSPKTNSAVAAENPLVIEHITVRFDRVVAQVRVSDERFTTTTPALIQALRPKYPYLLDHACVNSEGTTFGAVAENTSLPHLLEHVAIEAQAQLEPGEYAFAGKTSWTDRAALQAQVELSYRDDVRALAALRDACRAINDALSNAL